MNYTKGPWSISRRSKSTELKDIFISAGGEYVARVVVPYTSKSIEEYEANARLIAAAPDLLEVLQDIIECRDALLNNRELPMTTEQWEAKCFATIAKATGAS